MTSTTTYEEALEVLQKLTAEHSHEPYFKKAQIVYSDGFHGVDLLVDRVLWKEANAKISPRTSRVPVYYIMEG